MLQRPLVLAVVWVGAMAPAAAANVVISQVYSDGGNPGASYRNDYVELFNAGTAAVDLTGWELQVAQPTGSDWFGVGLHSSLQPGGHYLVQEGNTGGTDGAPLAYDIQDTLNLFRDSGKVALTSTGAALTVASPSGGSLVDLVGYGPDADGFEGTGAAPSASPLALFRTGGGCQDTNVNSADFTAGAAAPRNLASTPAPCPTPTDPPPPVVPQDPPPGGGGGPTATPPVTHPPAITAVNAASHSVGAKGIKLTVTLTLPATVVVTVDRCAHSRCTALKGSVAYAGKKGANRFVFKPRLRGKKLKRGRYRLHVAIKGAKPFSTLNVAVT